MIMTDSRSACFQGNTIPVNGEHDTSFARAGHVVGSFESVLAAGQGAEVVALVAHKSAINRLVDWNGGYPAS